MTKEISIIRNVLRGDVDSFRLLVQRYQNLPLDSGKTYFMINGKFSTRSQVLAEGDQVRIFQLLAGG